MGRGVQGGWRFGALGFRERIEPVVRRLVAQRLGLAPEWLCPDLSFVDDVGASPGDIAELVARAEREVGSIVDDAAIRRVRTYGDLVDALVAGRIVDDEPPPAVLLRTLVVPARRERRGVVARALQSTPYALDGVEQDARRGGPGTRLDVILPADAPLEVVAGFERRFAPLARCGVTVRVQHAAHGRTRAVA